ncbi:hypothetical protein E4U21_005979 [Claviceps maximensis]|nr:hypothetical protein E4U21_005979 [Claviceps maximensis]
MSKRGEMGELRRKPLSGPFTTNPYRPPTPTDLPQDQEDVEHSRAVAAWLTLMESNSRPSHATPSFPDYTTAFSMEYQPQAPRSRLSVIGARLSRTTRQRENLQEPQHHPFEVSPVTTPSEHLPALAFAVSPTMPAVPLTDDPRDSIDKAFPNLHECTSSKAVAVAVAVTTNSQPSPMSKDMSAVALQFQDQPVAKTGTEKRTNRPRIIAVRPRHRLKQQGQGDDISSWPENKDKVKDSDKVQDKDKVKYKSKVNNQDKRKSKDKHKSNEKHKQSAPGEPETCRVHIQPTRANRAASHVQPHQRHHDNKAAVACRLHQRHKLHHENILLHPRTTSLLSSTNPSPLHLDPCHRTLKHCLAKHPSGFDEPLVSYLTRQILLGLAHLHRRGVTHRNIRTSTVFVGPNGTCKLGGLHHAIHHDDTPSKTRYSPRVAPETLALQESTATSKLDIWDLGILVLEMLGPSGRWRKHDVIRALLLEPMDGGVLLLEKVDGGKMSVHARLFLMDCLKVSPFRRSTADALLAEHEFCKLDDKYDFGKTALGRSLRGK